MGELITITRSQTPAREIKLEGASAEILFFTGVRYYRMVDEVSPQTVIKRRRSERAAKAASERRLKRVIQPAAPASA